MRVVYYVVVEDDGNIWQKGQCYDEPEVPDLFSPLIVDAKTWHRLDCCRHYYDADSNLFKDKGDFSLSEVPLPCKVTIEDQVYHCDSQPFFEFDQPDVYSIRVNAGARYLVKDFLFDAQLVDATLLDSMQLIKHVSPPDIAKARRDQQRRDKIASIVVTISTGKSFDGDEDSQARMARICDLLSPGDAWPWRLADNTETLVTKEEFIEARRRAFSEQSRIVLAS